MSMVLSHRQTLISLGIGAMVLAAAGMTAIFAADDKQPDAVAKKSQLERDLIGTWILAGTPDKFDDPPPAKGPLKVLHGQALVVHSSRSGDRKGGLSPRRNLFARR